jgi:SAM-dependent methyltransferase
MSSTMTGQEVARSIADYAVLARRMHQEQSAFVDPYTGNARADLVTYRTRCPLCGSQEYRFIFAKHGFDHMVCEACDLIFTLQVLDPAKAKHIESADDGDTYGELKSDSSIGARDRGKFEHAFAILAVHARRPIRRVFDVGSNVGTFLDWARERYEIVGHEYHHRLRAGTRSRGHHVIDDPLETMTFEGQFDVITCWDYLDHLLDPAAVITNLTRGLAPGGLVFWAINNRYSLSARMLHERSPIFIGPQHTMHFGVPQLVRLMAGYELVHHESYVSELNWLSNWLSFKDPEFGDAPLIRDLLDPARICELGLGFKVNAVFRKV